jgi:RES domain-containing protein
MRVVRLCTRRHPKLDGEGPRLFGSRWNSPGRPVVYAASCGALAALEYLVHAKELPVGMLIKWIEVPDTLPFEKIDSVPSDNKAFRRLGDDWLDQMSTAVLRVPSVLVPRQWNLLLNPIHPLFPATKVTDEAPFAFDSRLLSSFPTP